jgi:hypothetical protein
MGIADDRQVMFTRQIIIDLLQTSKPQQQKLEETYRLLPATRCRRRTRCCAMLPEMTLIEALAAMQLLVETDAPLRHQLTRNIVRYFFTNPALITSCPFLHDHDCLVYRSRFFGCRAYGLWSQDYYDSIADRSRRTKKTVQLQWHKLGVSLPPEVVEFQVPYCRHVETVGEGFLDDEKLARVSDMIESLSEQCDHRHQEFNREYFTDLSFLVTSLIFGVTAAVQLKFAVVRDMTIKGDRTRLDKVINELPDIFAAPA